MLNTQKGQISTAGGGGWPVQGIVALLVDSGAWQSRTLAQSPPDVPGLAQVSEAAGTWSFPSPGSLEAHLSAQGRLIHGYIPLSPPLLPPTFRAN